MGRSRALLRYGAARLGLVPLMLWLIASLVFLLLRVAPGDPVDAVLGSRAPAAAKAAMRTRLGLDQSLLDQYIDYLRGLLHGDLGQGLINQEPVRDIINRTLPASLELSLVALMLAAIVGLGIGFSGIARPEGKLDLAGRLYGLGTYALPPFWVAMLLQLLFAVSLGWLPVGGRFPPSLTTGWDGLLSDRQSSCARHGGVEGDAAPSGAPRWNPGSAAERHLHHGPAAESAANPAG